MRIHLSIFAVILICGLIWERPTKEWMIENRLKGEAMESNALPWIIVFGYIAFLAAMRSNINDTSVYVRSFNQLSASLSAIRDELAGGDFRYTAFSVLGILFKRFISTNYHWWFAMFAVSESIIFVRILRREAVSFFDTCFFFFCGGLYFNYFSMMRQWVAVVIVFSGIYALRDRRFVKYALICVIAGLFHPSAFLMIPVFFLVQGKPWSGRQLGYIGLFVLLMLVLNPVLSGLDALTSDTTYNYVIDALQTKTGSSWVRMVIAAVPVFLSYQYANEIDDPLMEVCINMAVVDLMLNILATFTNGLYVIRFSTYTNIFSIVLYPYLLNIAIQDSNQATIKFLFYIFYIGYYFYSMNHTDSFYYNSDILGLFR